MEKSVFSKEYGVFLAQLRNARKQAGLTQVRVGELLDKTQSWISKCERGERRLDVVELWAFCRAYRITLKGFAEQLERALKPGGRRRGR